MSCSFSCWKLYLHCTVIDDNTHFGEENVTTCIILFMLGKIIKIDNIISLCYYLNIILARKIIFLFNYSSLVNSLCNYGSEYQLVGSIFSRSMSLNEKFHNGIFLSVKFLWLHVTTFHLLGSYN